MPILGAHAPVLSYRLETITRQLHVLSPVSFLLSLSQTISSVGGSISQLWNYIIEDGSAFPGFIRTEKEGFCGRTQTKHAPGLLYVCTRRFKEKKWMLDRRPGRCPMCQVCVLWVGFTVVQCEYYEVLKTYSIVSIYVAAGVPFWASRCGAVCICK